MSTQTFQDLNLNSWIIKQCASIGVKTPTPIQVYCIPEILGGKHCMGIANTGSGKTLAFTLPVVQKLCEDPYGIFALVLTPTRELAFQIAEQVAVIGKPMNLKHCVIVGGLDMVAQAEELSKRPHIVVATPGRLADHLTGSNNFHLSRMKFLVFDEADRLLSGQFDEQMKIIHSHLPKDCQNLFFSATMTHVLVKVREMTNRGLFFYQAPLSRNILTVEQLDQKYLLCTNGLKSGYLVQLIREYQKENEEGNIVIFSDTCWNCQVLSLTLLEINIPNIPLHGKLKQLDRLAAFIKFRSNVTKIMVTTDLGSRGLDISTVGLVINLYVPKVPEDYVHKVGRTARAGKAGRAVTLVTPHEIKYLKMIEEFIHTKLTELKVNDSDVGKHCAEVALAEGQANIKIAEERSFQSNLKYKRREWVRQGLNPDVEAQRLREHRREIYGNKNMIPKWIDL